MTGSIHVPKRCDYRQFTNPIEHPVEYIGSLNFEQIAVEGPVTFCVWGGDDAGNWQDADTPTKATWRYVPSTCDSGFDAAGIRGTDRSLFSSATYRGIADRAGESSHLFGVILTDNTSVQISFNADDFDLGSAKRKVRHVGFHFGRVPYFLRDGSPGVHVISLPGAPWSGLCCGADGLIFHNDKTNTESSLSTTSNLRTIVHELAHYVDSHGRQESWSEGSAWAAAAAADDDYITNYAKTNVYEDFAETVPAYLAARYHPDRLCPYTLSYIERTVPNRLAYLDSVLDDHGRMCPLVGVDCP